MKPPSEPPMVAPNEPALAIALAAVEKEGGRHAFTSPVDAAQVLLVLMTPADAEALPTVAEELAPDAEYRGLTVVAVTEVAVALYSECVGG